MERIDEFLKKSLLPAILQLLNVVKAMSDSQSKEHDIMTEAIGEGQKQTADMQKAIRTLDESVSALTRPITQLVESVNESNRLQAEQNRLLNEMKESLAENTARIGTMNLALAKQEEDPGIAALYDALRREGGA